MPNSPAVMSVYRRRVSRLTFNPPLMNLNRSRRPRPGAPRHTEHFSVASLCIWQVEHGAVGGRRESPALFPRSGSWSVCSVRLMFFCLMRRSERADCFRGLVSFITGETQSWAALSFQTCRLSSVRQKLFLNRSQSPPLPRVDPLRARRPTTEEEGPILIWTLVHMLTLTSLMELSTSPGGRVGNLAGIQRKKER